MALIDGYIDEFYVENLLNSPVSFGDLVNVSIPAKTTYDLLKQPRVTKDKINKSKNLESAINSGFVRIIVPPPPATNSEKLIIDNLYTTNKSENPNELAPDITPSIIIYNTHGITIDGSGSIITTGIKGSTCIQNDCTIIKWNVYSTDLSFTTGSITFDLWKTTYANYDGITHPVIGDSICGSGIKPSITVEKKGEGTDFTGWTTTNLSAGDIISFNIDSVSSLTRVSLFLTVSTTEIITN